MRAIIPTAIWSGISGWRTKQARFWACIGASRHFVQLVPLDTRNEDGKALPGFHATGPPRRYKRRTRRAGTPFVRIDRTCHAEPWNGLPIATI